MLDTLIDVGNLKMINTYTVYALMMRMATDAQNVFIFFFLSASRGTWNFLTKDRTCAPCIEVQSLKHSTTMKILMPRTFKFDFLTLVIAGQRWSVEDQ